MKYIDSVMFFDAVINAADSMGYLDDIKEDITLKKHHDDVSLKIPFDAEISCTFSYDYDEVYVDFSARRCGKLTDFGFISCPDCGLHTYRTAGAAAALLQYVATELILRLNWFGNTSSPLDPDPVLDRYVERLCSSIIVAP